MQRNIKITIEKEKEQKMIILITGASGFIGTNFLEKMILDGHNVLNIDFNKPKIKNYYEIIEINSSFCSDVVCRQCGCSKRECR